MIRNKDFVLHGLISVSNLANPGSPKQLAYSFLSNRDKKSHTSIALNTSQLVTAYPGIDS